MKINYQVFGNPTNTAMVLIAGLGEQMYAWPDQFCLMLAAAGFFVIRFDNRDTGGSTKYESKGIPDLKSAWMSYAKGNRIDPPYTLADMAGDAIHLIDELNIEKAYFCGISLGGMIAQNISFSYEYRMIGMICIGTSTGELHLPPSTPEVQSAMFLPPPQSRKEYVKHMVSIYRIFSGGSNLYDPEYRYEIAAVSYDACYYPQGYIRQSIAMLADGSRRSRLEKVNLPTLVLHGALDPVALPEHGYAVSHALKSSNVYIIPEWGHGLDYPKLWPDIINAMKSMNSPT